MGLRSLDRILQSQGFGTRKACATATRKGLVKVDGELCKEPRTTFALEGLAVEFEGVAWRCSTHCYFALHKPAGTECSRKPSHHPSVMSLLPPHLMTRGVQPVGRLDQDTTGLLLLTDDGAFNHAMSSPKRHVPKRYEVSTASPVDAALVELLLCGVQLHGETAPVAALACAQLGEQRLELTLAQGKYHQVKRMMAAAGNACVGLHRAAIGGLALSDMRLPLGEARALSDTEFTALRG